jgi:hypothetical protein
VRAAVRVEVLHHEGCPLFAPALALVRDCVRELGVDAIVSERVARSPSPTVLLDGRDVMALRTMSCLLRRVGSTCRPASV